MTTRIDKCWNGQKNVGRSNCINELMEIFTNQHIHNIDVLYSKQKKKLTLGRVKVDKADGTTIEVYFEHK